MLSTTTMEQLKSSQPESLWHYLAQIPLTLEANIFYALMLGGVLGVILNYFIKWTRGEIAGSLWAYLFVDNPRHSWLAISALATELLAEVASNVFVGANSGFVGWGVVLLSGFKSGYTVDNLLNKGARPVWTDEQRTAAAPPEAKP